MVLPAPLGPISPQTSPASTVEREVVHGAQVVVIHAEVANRDHRGGNGLVARVSSGRVTGFVVVSQGTRFRRTADLAEAPLLKEPMLVSVNDVP